MSSTSSSRRTVRELHRIVGERLGLVSGQRVALDAIGERGGEGLLLALGDVDPAPGAYQAGIWCPHQSWRETHHGSMFSSQSK